MRLSQCLSLTFVTLAAASEPTLAQPPNTVTCPEPIAAIAACYTTQLDTGAYLLAAVPRNWNGNLIVFAHGGPGPIQPSATYGMGSLRRYSLEVKLGYAWIASTYRYLGFGVQQSADDTDQARQYFIDRSGGPSELSFMALPMVGLSERC
jgi:hypothetical protein